ncbi:MAG TPA: hypothetical protein VGJ60_33965 [Chloroflexota bacterium]|jgi:hypothetical protein
MNRQPWSMPKGHELWHVAIGLVLGVVVTYLLMLTRRDFAGFILFLVAMLLPAIWMLINGVAYFHEQDVESRERLAQLQREADAAHRRAEASRWWLETANRAATNKRVGLAWTGRSRGAGR